MSFTTTIARMLFVSAVAGATWLVQQEKVRLRLEKFKKNVKHNINSLIHYPLFKEKPALSPEIFADLFFDCLVKENQAYPDTLFSRLKKQTADFVQKTLIALSDFLHGEAKTPPLDCLKIEPRMVALFIARCKQHFDRKKIESPRRIFWNNKSYAGYEAFAESLAHDLLEAYGYRLLREVVDPVWSELDPRSWGWLASTPSEWEIRQHLLNYKDNISSSSFPIVTVASLLEGSNRSFPRANFR